MLNHARNLLLNVAPGTTQNCPYPGDELIDPGYKPFVPSTAIQAVRSILFGAAPDRVMLNYRTRQVLALLHAGPLVEFVTDLDPRTSYGFDDEPFFDASLYAPTVTPLTALPEDKLLITGSPQPPDISGQMAYQYRVDILTAETLRLERQKPTPYASDIHEFEIASGWSNRIPLGNSGLNLATNTDSPGATWLVEFLVRPQYDLGEIAVSLQSVGEPALVELFGTAKVEPYLTFKNLWFDAKDLPFKLGGILLALIYRSNERRVRGD